ncbi:MAG: acyl carrier protein [Spirochaetes bacterium]|nr:acyl carrier protein [Spirochaetota bacterium]
METVQEVITNFIKENFIMGRSEINLAPDQSLLESGIIDSTGVLELVMFIEEKYSVTIDDEELIPENLDGINNIVNFLKNKGIN